MIVKIRRVRDFRAFNGWRWPTDLPPFQQINLIYGVNGTGKSTLASLLQQAHLDVGWASGLQADVVDNGGTSRAVSSAADAIWKDVRVFNKSYVEANLRFDEDAGSAAVPLLVLGEKRVEAEEERTRLEKRLDEIAETLPAERKQAKQAKTQYDAIATNRARLIAQELGSLGGRYDPRSYTAAKVRQAIKADTAGATPAAVDVSDSLSLAKSPSKPVIEIPLVTAFSLDDLAQRAVTLLSESAVAKVLSDLEDPAHSRWVQDGLALHHGRDTCLFCAGTLRSERRRALEEHFDMSLVTLQSKIDSLLQDVTGVRQAASEAIAKLPRADDLFEVQRDDYGAALITARTELKSFRASAEKLAAIIDKKRETLFKAVSTDVSVELGSLSLSPIVAILQGHNETARDFEAKQKAAAKEVESARIVEIRDEYRALEQEHEQRNGKVAELEDEEKRLRRELAALDSSALNAEPIATRLNEDLAHLLGRSDLAFTIDGQGYRISRNGSPAHHLSEGERNAISLLYFLRSLETHQTKAAHSIVVIDDPVSSLDGSTLVGASTHLWTRLVGVSKCRQLFLLTHNFELFRLWASHLEHYPKKADVAITYGVYEMRVGAKEVDNGSYRRIPIILAWPDDPKVQARLRSEYHYLFWRVASALRDCVDNPSAESDVEAATVLPNVCRRLLEGFLGFKYPALLGNLHAQIMRASDGAIGEAMRARVLRFAHAYSHNQEADTTLPVARPESVEMLHVVLEFMRIIDRPHFDAMCDAVGVDSDFLGQLSS